jgi:hypothetical protein
MLERAPRYDFRDPAAYIMANARPGDKLAVRYWQNRLVLDYYFAQMHMQPGFVESVFPDWGPDMFIQGRYPMDTAEQEFFAKHMLAEINSAAEGGGRLWFLIGGETMGSFDWCAPLRTIQAHMVADYASVQSGWINGFTVWLCSDPRVRAPSADDATPHLPRSGEETRTGTNRAIDHTRQSQDCNYKKAILEPV